MKTTMKSSNGYNTTSKRGYKSESARGYKATSPRAIKAIATKTVYGGTFRVPKSFDEKKQRPYMYVCMRVRHDNAGVRANHVGVVINKFLVAHKSNENVQNLTHFAKWATRKFGKAGAKLTYQDIYNYQNAKCQPKFDKLTLINQAFQYIEPGFSELDVTGWTTIGAGDMFRG